MKKAICMALCLLMLSTVSLSACDKEDSTSKDVSGATSTTSDGLNVANVPIKDYGGKTLTFLTCGVNQTADSEILFNENAERMSSVVNEAIQRRNHAIEERFNVEIKEMFIFDAGRKNKVFAETVRQNAAAGTNDFQVIVPCIYDGATLAANGMLVDLYSVPYLDMSKPWWDQTFNEELTINNKLYFTLGDIGIINKSATAALMFNKELIKDHNLENPYQLVKDMKWTMDKVFSMAKTISSDLDGDGNITYRDSMGWSGQLDDMWALFYGSGEKIASIGSDGYPTLTMYNERSVGVIDKMLDLVQDKKVYLNANDYFGETTWPVELTIKPFLEGRCLFFSANISSTDGLVEMEDDFGVVPVPLYDESQEEYHSLINPWVGNCFAIPITVTDDELEFTGIILESLAAESRNYVYPAYYEVALKYQKTRDQDSVEMLDIIFTSRGCDIGIIHAFGGLDVELQNLQSKERGSFTSTYQSLEEKAKSQLEATVKFYKEMQ
jgi:hypothetical protein